jgi:hypothetical protein
MNNSIIEVVEKDIKNVKKQMEILAYSIKKDCERLENNKKLIVEELYQKKKKYRI